MNNRIALFTYLAISLAAGGLFFLAATLAGTPSLVARLGGAGWTAFLALIIAMPQVVARQSRRHRR
ncbi:MAG: hypothetical protein NTV14_04975 [Coprothermobacterota bacterium]|nr:hypothetical protein [Coprothermobacterota bacterium]